MSEQNKEPVLLPHHKQQDLCETRLPYRQGRKLTAVKAYTITNESRHLLIFGVPSLNLRQETKALLSKFGRLQLNITKYPSEQFTETYHAIFEDIQSARIAKKMLDTKNFYGGILHICYAPEFETIQDTRDKLQHRQRSVVARLKNLQKTTVTVDLVKECNTEENSVPKDEKKVYNMGYENTINYGKRKQTDYKSVTHCKLTKSRNIDKKMCVAVTDNNEIENKSDKKVESVSENSNICEVVDITSAETEIVTNINEALNYDNFGKELIKQVPYKPVNKIKFSLNKNT